jgi:hypothetical protein
MPDWLALNLWYAMVLLGLIVAVLHWYLLRRLRIQHHETWVRLGSPTLILNNSIQNSRLTLKFLSRREYRELGDSTLNRVADAERALSWIGGTIFLAILVNDFLLY